ncbi:hypothetical protein GCM10009841_01970 [Microlunatus panaciterrae]|uniref:Lipoprotein with Yx(FWY)xxD motif n=1 Tax=Microlunatus panaciterrae TaxID=400768 RepID=A0ABS2RKT6_9ACTN|nr:hypothetical protein [Microlunatus panaciterrae]MBM7799278.1 putative lipoprotein with Yx(FWY)xxD motif [Microlunatus panaciterrae]
MRSKTFVTLAGLTLSVVALAGCSSAQQAATPAGGSTPSPSASKAAAELSVADSSLGKIIVDAHQMTAYYFTKDTANSGKSACAGPCLQAWPPITTTSDKPVVEGITGKVATITLADGKKQLTVNGMPIYLFANDKSPGDVNGQGVNKVWYVVAPDGKMITKAGGGY